MLLYNVIYQIKGEARWTRANFKIRVLIRRVERKNKQTNGRIETKARKERWKRIEDTGNDFHLLYLQVFVLASKRA